MVHKICRHVCFAFFAVASLDQTILADEADSSSLLFKGLSIIDIDTGLVKGSVSIQVDNERFSRVSSDSRGIADDDVKIVDLKGLYAIPGLFEMHGHIPIEREFQKWSLSLFAVNGVTTIRGAIGNAEHLALRARILEHSITGPRLITAGTPVKGGGSSPADSIEKMVRAQKRSGFDFVKIHPEVSAEQLEALAVAAKKYNIPFGGHVSLEAGLDRSLRLGQSSFDHLDGFFEAWVADHAAEDSDMGLFGSGVVKDIPPDAKPAFVRSLTGEDIAVIPTESFVVNLLQDYDTKRDFSRMPGMEFVPSALLTYWLDLRNFYRTQFNLSSPDHYLKMRKRLIAELFDAGIPILSGSDAPQVLQVPGFSLHQELELLVAAGMSPLHTLQAATINSARFLGIDDMTGKIAPGLDADMVVLRSNPLDDISNVRDIYGVLLRGKWFGPEQIAIQYESVRAFKPKW